MPEAERPGKVIVTIVTDGMENSSREYTYDQVKNMIEEQKNKYSWTFIFIGANIDAAAVGSQIGVDSRLAKQYTANDRGVASLYKSLSVATTMARNATMDCVGAMSAELDKIQ